MFKQLWAGVVAIAIGSGVCAQVSAPATRVIAKRGNANPAMNGFCYFYGSAPDILNGGSQPPAITGLNVEIYDVDFNPASSYGFPTVILTENQGNSLIVCRADNGTQLHVIPNMNTGTTEPDPVGVTISEDGVLFVTNKIRLVTYRASDAVEGSRYVLVPGHSIGNDLGDASGIHCTGNVRDGTCRLFLGVNDRVWVYDVSGTLPDSLKVTPVTTFKPMDGGSAFSKVPGISGTRDLLHIIDDAVGVREAVALNSGVDGIPGTVDDIYADAQTIADNQVGQAYYPSGVAVIDRPEVHVGLPGAAPGIYALFEGNGLYDGIVVGSLGTSTAAGVVVPATNGEQNDAGVTVDEDYDNDGAWDGGMASGGLNGGKLTGSVSIGKLHGEISIWFTSAGTNGGFGRLVLPQSSVPVRLSGFQLE